MGLFVCDRCESVDNTAPSCSRYHAQSRARIEATGATAGAERLCSACDPPDGLDGWHGKFERRRYDGTRQVVNR